LTGDRIRGVATACGVSMVSLAFAGWSAEFIRRTSFIAMDGHRRFCLFDDAMISMRYAWNLVHGHGLVWNAGERVEGITNLLMTLYMALMIALFGKYDAVLAVQVSGAVFLLAAAACCMKAGELIAKRCGLAPSPVLSILFFAAPLVYFPLCYWTLMGMENGLMTALLMGAVLAALRADGASGTRPAVPVLVSLAFLTRPDAAIPGALVMAHRLLAMRGRPGRARTFAAEAGLALAVVAAVTAFRLAYYGSAVPNTFGLKLTGMPLDARIADGLAFVGPFVESAIPLLAFAALAALLGRNRHVALALAIFAAAVAYQIWVGGDAWNLWRLTCPTVPLLLVLAITGAAAAVGRLGTPTRALRFLEGRAMPLAVVGGVFAAAVAAGTMYCANERFTRNITFARRPLYVKYSRTNTDQGMALKELLLPGATVGCTWAGTIPYYSEAAGVDFLGKNDPRIAALPPDLSGELASYGMRTLPGHNKYDLDYSIKELRPTYLQVVRWGRQDLALWAAFGRYRRVPYKGVSLLLLRDSEHVRWELVEERYRPNRPR